MKIGLQFVPLIPPSVCSPSTLLCLPTLSARSALDSLRLRRRLACRREFVPKKPVAMTTAMPEDRRKPSTLNSTEGTRRYPTGPVGMVTAVSVPIPMLFFLFFMAHRWDEDEVQSFLFLFFVCLHLGIWRTLLSDC